jgi:hypothetical protein
MEGFMTKRWPLIDWTMGFRPRRDQYDAIEEFRSANPELRWTDVIRRGIDLVIAELRAARAPEVYRSISLSLPPPPVESRTGQQSGTLRKPAGRGKQSKR